MRAILTVLGKDRVGIIYHVSKILYEANANIEELDQTVLHSDIFSMVMLIDVSNINCDYSELKDKLENLGKEIQLTIRIQQEEIFNSMYNI